MYKTVFTDVIKIDPLGTLTATSAKQPKVKPYCCATILMTIFINMNSFQITHHFLDPLHGGDHYPVYPPGLGKQTSKG